MHIERGTTNDAAPFQPGERIVYNGEVLEVISNDGDGFGSVRYPDGKEVDSFQWNGLENVRRFVGVPDEH